MFYYFINISFFIYNIYKNYIINNNHNNNNNNNNNNQTNDLENYCKLYIYYKNQLIIIKDYIKFNKENLEFDYSKSQNILNNYSDINNNLKKYELLISNIINN